MYEFCAKTLGIENPQSCIKIDRSHRIGARAQNKVRPIVVKFQDTRSKQIVKNSLRTVKLNNTPYNVSDQYPPEVQERRRSLIPVMEEARRENKTVVLVRDKLYINNRLYTPPKDVPNN